MKYILLAIVLMLSMLGLAEFLHAVRLFWRTPKKRGLTYSVIVLNHQNPEEQISFAAEQRAWMGCSYADCVIALDTGLCEEDRRRCSDAAKRHQMVFCNIEQFKQFL